MQMIRCFSMNNLECFEDQSKWNDGDGDNQLAPVLQVTEVIVVRAERTVNGALVNRLDRSCPQITSSAHTI